MIPSISAVTGISPGRYLWRVVIAFHIGKKIIFFIFSESYRYSDFLIFLGPRILIAAVYYNFLMSFVPLVASKASTTVSQVRNFIDQVKLGTKLRSDALS